MPFTNQTKHSSSFSNVTKNSSTFRKYLRHGKYPSMADLAGFNFTDTPFRDSSKQLKDFTFAELADASYSNQTKH